MDKFGSYFASIMHKKMGLNTLQDTKKKQQIPSKDNFWPVSDGVIKPVVFHLSAKSV